MKDAVLTLGILLVFDVMLDDLERRAAHCSHEVAMRPKRRQSAFQRRKLFTENARTATFKMFNQAMYAILRVNGDQQGHVSRHDFKLDNFTSRLRDSLRNYRLQTSFNLAGQHGASILRAPKHMIGARVVELDTWR